MYPIRDVIDAANEDNWHYRTFLGEPLEHLAGKLDMKYWSELNKIRLTIANDAEHAELEAADPLTEAATLSKRPSTSDQVLAFLAYIEQCCGIHDGAPPACVVISASHHEYNEERPKKSLGGLTPAAYTKQLVENRPH
ncbi:MAG: hypothetical protein AB7E55_17120 [Pigmentiphaga sp.]